MSSPSNLTVPEVASSSLTISRAVVDLPQPDSPTMPSVSPRFTVSDTSSTAWTTPLTLAKTLCLTANHLVRFVISTSGPSPARLSGDAPDDALIRRSSTSPAIRVFQISLLRSGESRQASRWPPGSWTSGGCFESQGSNRYLQRGWNGQPGGGLSIDGGEPSIGSSVSRRFSIDGIDSSSPQVYGCCDIVKISAGGSVLHRRGRRT